MIEKSSHQKPNHHIQVVVCAVLIACLLFSTGGCAFPSIKLPSKDIWARNERTLQEKSTPEDSAEKHLSSATSAFYSLFEQENLKKKDTLNGNYGEICYAYNSSLEQLLRLCLDDKGNIVLNEQGELRIPRNEGHLTIRLDMVSGNWNLDEIESLRFSAECKANDLPNEFCQEGLGVSLVAKRKEGQLNRKEEKYYPSNFYFPITLFFRPETSQQGEYASTGIVLELYDPLVSSSILVEGNLVPLQVDLTAPLACYLTNPNVRVLPTMGLLRPDELLRSTNDESSSTRQSAMGIYMMQPYDPQKIPVVMIHGLWSSPLTWTAMFNALQSDQELQEHYQFWFYFYPSGQPFWVSAAQLREDIAQLQDELAPEQQTLAMKQMVLIGHSMGGLLAKMQVIDSDNHFWQRVCEEPFDLVELDDTDKEDLRQWFFFEANPSVRRVITIATPFQGSKVSNDLTRWFAGRMIDLPKKMSKTVTDFLAGYQDSLKSDSLLKIRTSVGSLALGCPALIALEECYMPREVISNNIVGVLPDLEKSRFAPIRTDGVVNFSSAHRPHVESEKVIPSQHMHIHSRNATIQETSRILKEHLYQMKVEWNAKQR